MVGIHIGGAEGVFESGGQRRGWKGFVVDMKEGWGGLWRTGGGSGFFCRGAEGARVVIPDKIEMPGGRWAVQRLTWLSASKNVPGATRRQEKRDNTLCI